VLETILPANLFGFFLIFARVGAIFMVAPALGEIMVPARVRLVIALTTSLAIWPVVSTNLPSLPGC
jgi:flagellar biosynthesis protein FliR